MYLRNWIVGKCCRTETKYKTRRELSDDQENFLPKNILISCIFPRLKGKENLIRKCVWVVVYSVDTIVSIVYTIHNVGYRV